MKKGWSVFGHFGPKPEQYTPNAPFTQFPYAVSGHTFDLMFQMNEAGCPSCILDWLEQLKGWLQDGRWLERNHPDGRAAKLDTVLVGLDYHIGLLYQITDNGQYFQIFPERTERKRRGGLVSSEEGGEPELYTGDEISAWWNSISKDTLESSTMCSMSSFHRTSMWTSVLCLPKIRGTITLVNHGNGRSPDEDTRRALRQPSRACGIGDLFAKRLEAGEEDECWYWPIRLLKQLARLPMTYDTWLGWGHTVDNQEPYAANTELQGVILIDPQNVEDGAEKAVLPNGGCCPFYQVIPLYAEEMEYKTCTMQTHCLTRWRESAFVVDTERPNVCKSR